MGSFTEHLSILFWVGFRWDGGNGSHLFLQKSVNIYVKKKWFTLANLLKKPAMIMSCHHLLPSWQPLTCLQSCIVIPAPHIGGDLIKFSELFSLVDWCLFLLIRSSIIWHLIRSSLSKKGVVEQTADSHRLFAFDNFDFNSFSFALKCVIHVLSNVYQNQSINGVLFAKDSQLMNHWYRWWSWMLNVNNNPWVEARTHLVVTQPSILFQRTTDIPYTAYCNHQSFDSASPKNLLNMNGDWRYWYLSVVTTLKWYHFSGKWPADQSGMFSEKVQKGFALNTPAPFHLIPNKGCTFYILGDQSEIRK